MNVVGASSTLNNQARESRDERLLKGSTAQTAHKLILSNALKVHLSVRLHPN